MTNREPPNYRPGNYCLNCRHWELTIGYCNKYCRHTTDDWVCDDYEAEVPSEDQSE